MQAMSLPTRYKNKFLHSLHVMECFTLVPLLGPEYKLEKIPDSYTDGSGVTGINITRSGYSDVRMYFDKSSGLVTCINSEAPDDNGHLVTETFRYSNYQNFEGFSTPGRTESTVGSDYSDVQTIRYLLPLNSSDEGVFNTPN
jgi:hypothetical protein